MIQHQFEQSGSDLGKINNKILFIKVLHNCAFHLSMIHQTPYLNIAAIKLSEKEMARETFGSSNLGLIWKKC